MGYSKIDLKTTKLMGSQVLSFFNRYSFEYMFLSCHMYDYNESTVSNCLNVKKLCLNQVPYLKFMSATGYKLTNTKFLKNTQPYNKSIQLEWLFIYKLNCCEFEAFCSHLSPYAIDVTFTNS